MAKKILKIFGCIILVIALIIIGFATFILLGKDSTMKQPIGDINLSNVEDGVYTGSYNGFRFSDAVEVIVKNHEITDIKVIKPQLFAKESVYQELTEKVKEQQSLDVDAVTGATADTKAFLKAVENAIKNK
ncbi:FMN-binding protein [Acetanaerobacterium elongatum]|uniref:FMN-binding domain-containing protein n=1 Tax=Acetanaerobacterium elongatum TaxID=258515 RepID=A0A1G9WZA2_9FIRM|nr:FMN-binding protein [Acetanaerobacterium elongatum]SDM89778.1 FMN-binding domain-containing protein [Acetanaerobacterium elongatum]